MIRNTVTEAAETLAETPETAPELVAISVLALELPEPIGGWPDWLAARGVEIVVDNIGRKSITAEDARRLITERAEREERQRAEQARRRAEARKQPRLRPAGVPGIDGVPALAVMKQREHEAEQARKDRMKDEQYAGELVYRAYRDEDAS